MHRELICGIRLVKLAWWRARGAVLPKWQSTGKFKGSAANVQKFNIIFPFVVVCFL